MEYSLEAVRNNLRTRDGRRVFYLGSGDTITETARRFLQREGIPVMDPPQAEYRLESGQTLSQKPEELTSLHGNLLVPKTHPRIALRGKLDSLEGLMLLFGKSCPEYRKQAGELLTFVRELLRCEVLEIPAADGLLLGRTAEELRRDSQFPQKVFGIAHFMPEFSDSRALLELNRLRTAAREAELSAAACALPDGILRGLNRLSSALYLLMLQEKSARRPGTL